MDIRKRVRFEETGLGSMDAPVDFDHHDGEGPSKAFRKRAHQKIFTSLYQFLPQACPGLDDSDIDKIEEQESKEATQRKGKQIGLPEIDPDALPSSMVTKYLFLDRTYYPLFSTISSHKSLS